MMDCDDLEDASASATASASDRSSSWSSSSSAYDDKQRRKRRRKGKVAKQEQEQEDGGDSRRTDAADGGSASRKLDRHVETEDSIRGLENMWFQPTLQRRGHVDVRQVVAQAERAQAKAEGAFRDVMQNLNAPDIPTFRALRPEEQANRKHWESDVLKAFRFELTKLGANFGDSVDVLQAQGRGEDPLDAARSAQADDADLAPQDEDGPDNRKIKTRTEYERLVTIIRDHYAQSAQYVADCERFETMIRRLQAEADQHTGPDGFGRAENLAVLATLKAPVKPPKPSRQVKNIMRGWFVVDVAEVPRLCNFRLNKAQGAIKVGTARGEKGRVLEVYDDK